MAEKGQSQNLWRFAIYSGLRHGELAALAWEDIDLEAGTATVCRNLTMIGTFGPPQNRCRLQKNKTARSRAGSPEGTARVDGPAPKNQNNISSPGVRPHRNTVFALRFYAANA